MYVENERGLASHWGYNLGLEIKAYNKKRKLAGAPIILPQVFYCLELPEVMGVNFVENFTQLVEHGAKPMEQLRDWLAAGFPVNDMVFGA